MIKKNCMDCDKEFSINCEHGDPFAAFPMVCEPCIEKREAELEIDQLKSELRSKFKLAVASNELPRDFRQTRFALSDPTKEAVNVSAWKKAQEWNGEKNLYLCGNVGTGKSHMGLCCLHAQFVQAKDCLFVSARRMLKDSELFDEGIFSRAKDAEIVLLDDLDKAGSNARRIEALWEFFDTRERTEHRTIITANISHTELVKHFAGDGGSNSSMAASIVDRINPVQVIRLTGTSLRG
jgi:DNA replication protein DnaC